MFGQHRQLGFGDVLNPLIDSSQFGRVVGAILLDDVDCEGYENSIGECRHSGWNVHNCHHSEDVAIKCSGKN